MQQLLSKDAFTFTVNQSFAEVIRACKQTPRQGQNGTWITNEIESAFIQLHLLGHAHSAEVWQGNELCGGLYGVRMGKVFFGESMFSHQSNASKFAFIKLVKMLEADGVELIDCQVYTSHLHSLGARMIPRADFLQMLTEL